MKLIVRYTAPVDVVLDTDTMSIERVIVVDEAVRIDKNERVMVLPEGGDLEPLANEHLDKLARLAVDEANLGWPAWEFGW